MIQALRKFLETVLIVSVVVYFVYKLKLIF